MEDERDQVRVHSVTWLPVVSVFLLLLTEKQMLYNSHLLDNNDVTHKAPTPDEVSTVCEPFRPPADQIF